MSKSVRRFEVESTVEYLPEDKLLEGLAHTGIKKSAWILHDKDKGVTPHYHALVWLSNPSKISVVCKWFSLPETQIQTIKSEVGAMVYLTHGNDPDKYQYSPDEVHATFDLSKAIAEENAVIEVSRARRAAIIEGIASGEIRGYNINEYLLPQEYCKCKSDIDNAFKYRQIKLMGDENIVKNVRVYWCYGQAGTGKTQWAKAFARGKGYSFFVSGSGSDFLDGYSGQDCLILDDVRPENVGAGTLLKLLDPNTRSTVKSRYANKWLEVKCIIVTCPISASAFWDKKDCKVEGDKQQLLRRIFCETEFFVDDDARYRLRVHSFTSDGSPKSWSNDVPNVAMSKLALATDDIDNEALIDIVTGIDPA